MERPSFTDVPTNKKLRTETGEYTTQSSTSQLAYQALNVVLKKLLVPDLGWSIEGLKDQTKTLKAKIMENRLNVLPRDTDVVERERLKQDLEKALTGNPLASQLTTTLFQFSRFTDFRLEEAERYLPHPISVSYI
jgi:hypothetical protein